jgi:poly(hydroxyalkanoate) depolymerase family esterase
MRTYAFARKAAGLAPVALLILVIGCSQSPPTPLEEVEEFGSNPGELRMLEYVPSSRAGGAPSEGTEIPQGRAADSALDKSRKAVVPLVVALHGCMQSAMEYGESSGWLRLADRWGFLLLLPEQRPGNNLTRCFNWYAPEDIQRGKGEAVSILQMIDRMRRDHPIDPQRIYVTGVSAGGAMTLALAAAYPDVFAGAAPLAGIAFGCASGLGSALACMWDPPDKDAATWGEAVRSATSHKGSWPRISVWQGEADSAVDPLNASIIVRQWLNVHGIDDQPEKADDLKGHVHSLYRDATRRVLVEGYRIKGMGHGVPVDPGPGENQCGKAGRFFPDVDICSSLYIARFLGLDR